MTDATQRGNDARYLRNLAWSIQYHLYLVGITDADQLEEIADRILGQPGEDSSEQIYWYACCAERDENDDPTIAPYVIGQGYISPLIFDGSPALPDTWRGSGPFLTEEDAWVEAKRFSKLPETQQHYKDMLT